MAIAIISKYIITSLLISLIFGATVLSSLIIKMIFEKDPISPYLFQLWSLVSFIIIWICIKPDIYILNTYNFINLENVLLIFMAVVPTSIIAFQAYKFKPNYQFKFIHFLDGASMEIPMRLLVQNLFIIFGLNTTIFHSLSLDILLNAIIWVQFIIVQEVIEGRRITKGILPEIIASFWFSIWVGILYKVTGNIIAPMVAHGLQRFITYKICMKFGEPIQHKTS